MADKGMLHNNLFCSLEQLFLSPLSLYYTIKALLLYEEGTKRETFDEVGENFILKFYGCTSLQVLMPVDIQFI